MSPVSTEGAPLARGHTSRRTDACAPGCTPRGLRRKAKGQEMWGLRGGMPGRGLGLCKPPPQLSEDWVCGMAEADRDKRRKGGAHGPSASVTTSSWTSHGFPLELILH